jgi:hypothetical protein
VKFPNRIAITFDENAPIGEPSMLAWKNLNAADEGKVAVYELVEEFDTKLVTKKRRKGTKTWFE